MNTYQHAQLDALGDATRRAILERLLKGPLPVGELARDFPISRPAISQHLSILKHAHLVVDRAAGTRRLYQVNPAGIDALRAYFDRFWTDALSAFKRAAEQRPNRAAEQRPNRAAEQRQNRAAEPRPNKEER